MSARRWSRPLATAALLFYTVLLALGAWHEDVRPAFLDGVHEWAMGWWRAIGVPPGQAVFSGEGQERSGLVQHLLTVVPEGDNGRGAPIPWRENEGRLVAIVNDPAEVLVIRLLTQADSYPPPDRQLPPQRANQRRLLRSLGRHFFSRLSPAQRSATERLIGRWSIDFQVHATGAIETTEKFLIVWNTKKAMEYEVLWSPTPEQLQQFGLEHPR